MDDKLTWLRACLDDDERVARAAADGTLDWTISQPGPSDPSSPTLLGKSLVASCDPATLTPEEGEHIARWDPARVLAEISAKRRILDLHAESDFPYDPDNGPGDYSWTARCNRCYQDAPCTELRLLAQPYADRPGFPEEWLS